MTTSRNILLIVIFFFTTFGIQAQKLRPVITKLVDSIAKYNELEQEHVGYAGITTNQYENFIKLRNKATTEELLLLLENKNSVVKGYASWALADNKYTKLHEVLETFLNSGEIAPTQHGCIVSRNELASEFYYRVYYQRYENELSTSDSIFFYNQLVQMDSVILYSKKDTRLLRTALGNNNANPKTYDRIKQLAEKKYNAAGLVALAKYKKQSDIPFIIDKGKSSFLAISSFPDNAFFDFLLSYKSQERSLDYFLAVSSFKNESARDVLTDIYPSCDSAQLIELYEGLIDNYCALYQDLILKIWEEQKTIDWAGTQQLIADSPQKASKAFAAGLLTDKRFNLLEINEKYGTKDSILKGMLRVITKYDNELILPICNKNLQTARFSSLIVFLTYINENKLTATSASILQRLKGKNQAYEIFHLMDSLLLFNDVESKKELTAILITNQKDWDWGNWSDAFRKTFNANDIQIQ